MDPMAAMYAEADMLDRAVNNPRRFVIVLGVWVLFLPGLIAGIFLMINEIQNDGGSSGFFFFWFAAGLTVISAIVLFRITNNYFRPPHDR